MTRRRRCVHSHSFWVSGVSFGGDETTDGASRAPNERERARNRRNVFAFRRRGDAREAERGRFRAFEQRDFTFEREIERTSLKRQGGVLDRDAQSWC